MEFSELEQSIQVAIALLKDNGYKVTPAFKRSNNIYLAYVYINRERHLVGVDKKTRKAYKLDEKNNLIEPLEEIKFHRFQRWCIETI